MKYDVFISYSSLDQKVADGVCAYLEQHHIRCFIAYRDIPKGVVWARAIVDALDESRMMVVVFSGNFNRSEQVDREIELASEDKKPILTFRISNDAFKGVKKYYLKNLNWIDAFPQPEQCFGNLCENVQKLLGLNVVKLALQKQQDLQDEGSSLPQKQLENSFDTIDPEEQYNLACKYQGGDGVPKDVEKAVYFFRNAAEQGYATAQLNLGICYYKGQGVAKDLEQAAYWYRKAAEQGDAFAQRSLGYCYQYGLRLSKDLEQAVYWYRKAAELGNSSAQGWLGHCYQYGDGVPKDLTQAVEWYRRAAE